MMEFREEQLCKANHLTLPERKRAHALLRERKAGFALLSSWDEHQKLFLPGQTNGDNK